MDRRIAAIVIADVVGYSHLLETDEAGTVAALKDCQEDVFKPLVTRNKGRVVKLLGDGLLAEFASAVNAVECAIELQKCMAGANRGLPEERQMILRIGVSLGDVIVDDKDVYGEIVNIAARLERIAEPGSIVVSGTVFDYVKNKVAVQFDDLGLIELRNFAEPIRAYRIAEREAISPLVPSIITERPTVAVLPFGNLGGDPEQQYFSDGITQDIITELSRFRSLFVIARDTSFSFRGKSFDSAEIGRKLGVRYLVEGSVRKYADKVRITGQLVEAANGRCLWAENYDRDLAAIFAVQDDVTRSIVSVLAGRLEGAEVERARRKPTTNLMAYDCVLRAKAVMDRAGGEHSEVVRELLERAVTLDPDFGRAHALLAMSYIFEWFRTSSADCLAQAHELARRAVVCDNQDCWCQFALGFACLHLKRFDEAEVHYSHAVALNPNDADIAANMGELLTYLGRPNEAIEWIIEAMRANPLHPPSYWNDLAGAYYDARRYEDAVSAIMQMPQPFRWHDVCLAGYRAQMGDMERARRHARAVLKRWPDFSSRRFLSGEPYKHEADLVHNLEGLLKAGLPE